MTHEFGHWLKLNDISTSGCKDATMWHTVPTNGAEVPNNSQGVGDSDNNNVQYLNSTGTTWFGACNTTLFNDDPNKYFVDAGGNCSSWRIYGNN